ncbi:MAG: purine-nucleoside phosphorylase [Cellvibrionaceae bacterium]|jgi:purine-nucleoside phosphorylase
MSDIPKYEDYVVAAEKIRQITSQQPKIALVLGSGLSELADEVENPDVISSSSIPGWPGSTVQGHQGKLVFGTLNDTPVLVMQGRTHFYEGHSLQRITFPIRVMKLLGIETLIVTNAAGGINSSYTEGDLMIIEDHINFPGMVGNNPLIGTNLEAFGARFPDLTHGYAGDLRALAHQAASAVGVNVQEGVYACLSGPTYETPAELRFLNMIGADAVGMSTAHSTIVANHCGIRVLGISTITNMANLNPIQEDVTNHEEVLEIGKLVVPKLAKLLREIVGRCD